MRRNAVGFVDYPLKIPDEAHHDARIDKTANPRLALLEIAIQASILQRNRSLRGQNLQHCHPARSKHMGGQAIYEVEQGNGLASMNQRHARDQVHTVIVEVTVRTELVVARRVVQDDVLGGPDYIVENRYRQAVRFNRQILQADVDHVSRSDRLRLDTHGGFTADNQETALSAHLRDGGAHDRVDEIVEDDLTRNRLRYLDDRPEIEMLDLSTICVLLLQTAPSLAPRLRRS